MDNQTEISGLRIGDIPSKNGSEQPLETSKLGHQSEYVRSQNQRAAWNSIVLTLVLIAAKLLIGFSTGSLAMLSQATENGFDLIALLVTLLAVRISTIPADDDHLYGHGKFENLSALAQALLLLTATGFIAFEAFGRLFRGDVHIVEVNIWSFVVLVGSMLIDAWRTRMLHRASKANNSQALEANALHFLADMMGGGVVLIGLILVKYFKIQSADAWSAIIVSVFVAYLSVRLGKRAIDGLTDRFIEKNDYLDVRAAIERTTGVEAVRRLRVRQAGPYYFIEVTVEIERILPYATIENILKEVEVQISKRFLQSDITVHWYPIRTPRETPFETLKLITSEYGILPHNVEMTKNTAGEIFLDFHIEFPPKTTLTYAHTISVKIEQRVMKELPTISRVTSHLEEERSDVAPLMVNDVTEAQNTLTEEIASVVRASNPLVLDVHAIRLTEEATRYVAATNQTTRALKLVMTLDIAPEISLAEAHEITTNVELEVRDRFPELGRIVVHVNPGIA